MTQEDMFNTRTRSGKQLRPYQEEAIQCVEDSFKDYQNCIMIMATGLGKTFTAVEIARRRGGRFMWVAHRGELIEQAEHAIAELTGVIPQIEMADRTARSTLGYNQGCVVGSVQTLNAKRNGVPRLHRFDANYFNMLVTDEAHHAVAATWVKIANHFTNNQDLKHLGMTATPDRGDEAALGQIYDTCAYRYDIQDGVKDGWLVPIMIQRIYMDEINLSRVDKLAGDFNQGQLDHAMRRDKAMYGVSEALKSEVGSRKTLVFCASIEHAQDLTDILNANMLGSAALVTGKTPKHERKQLLDNYRAGNIQYLCNVGVATEGFDIPDIGCVAIARPTMSRALYAQMIGRGTRPLPNIVDGLNHAEQRLQSIHDSLKHDCLVLDFVGNSGQHKLVSAADVLGGNMDTLVVQEANRLARKQGTPVDTLELLMRAEAIVQARLEREKQINERKKIKAKASYRKKPLDPFDVLDIAPVLDDSEWRVSPLTPKQLLFLQEADIDTSTMTVKEQRKVFATMMERKNKGLATPKQLRLLKRYKYDTDGMTKDRASGIIGRLAKNNWKKVKIKETLL